MSFSFLIIFVCFVVYSSDLNSVNLSDELTKLSGLFLLILVESIDKVNDGVFKLLNRPSSTQHPKHTNNKPHASNIKNTLIESFLQRKYNWYTFNRFMDTKELPLFSQTSKETNKNVQNSFLIKQYDSAIETNNITIIKEMLSTEEGIDFIIEKCKTEQENQNLWILVITSNDIDTLKQMKFINIELNFTNDELIFIVKSFLSVDYYETYEFLIGNIKDLTNDIAYDLVFNILYYLQTPLTTKQQNSQFIIIKKLFEYPWVVKYLKFNFHDVILSLNIELVGFVINEFDVDVNKLFRGLTVLQLVVEYLVDYPNSNKNEFAYKMFDYLLLIGVDLNKTDDNKNDIYFYINQIEEENIKNMFLESLKRIRKI